MVVPVEEIERGLVEASLGGQVYKKRVAPAGKGKRDGTRTIVAWRTRDRAIFIYGFAKNKRDYINDRELKALKLLARELMGYEDKQLNKVLKAGELKEVISDE